MQVLTGHAAELYADFHKVVIEGAPEEVRRENERTAYDINDEDDTTIRAYIVLHYFMDTDKKFMKYMLAMSEMFQKAMVFGQSDLLREGLKDLLTRLDEDKDNRPLEQAIMEMAKEELLRRRGEGFEDEDD